MSYWILKLNPALEAFVIVGGVVLLSMIGLYLFRRFLMPSIKVHDGVNDAISGTVQAVGVFYGVTVGLLAIGVWNTWSSGADLAAREAAAVKALYRTAEYLPEPTHTQLCHELRRYVDRVIDVEWPAQRRGEPTPVLDMTPFRDILMAFQPANLGEQTRYAETLAAYDRMMAQRGLRLDAVNSGLSSIMWWVIFTGAAISIGVAYFFHLEDWKLHAALVGLIAGFLGLVLFMIVVNDRPFVGAVSIGPDSYILVRDRDMNRIK